MTYRAPVLALASAALFGISTPAAKALLGSIDPAVLAGLLYCGAGIGIAALRRISRTLQAGAAAEAPLSRADWPWLAGAIVSGGVAGPLLLMFGLLRTEAAAASLLLTLEGAATAMLAWFAFGEHINRRVALGMACLAGGALVLSWTERPTLTDLVGPIAIVGACVAWGLDNNLTRKVSLADPLQIVELKGLIAGPVNLVIALAAGASLPPPGSAAAAAAIGFLGYGVSIVLFILALRGLGAARTGAYFSTAPFIGAVAAIGLLNESPTFQLGAACALMAFGVWLHLTERHSHEHGHEAMSHAHAHVHDAHHQHNHRPSDPPGEPHSHPHDHPPIRHQHAHVPDMHHTHRH
jgi:drug/metabolite transporter (DMT)-like permease